MRWIAGIAIFLAIVCAALWLARKPIAKSFAERWCASQELTCTFEFAALEFDDIRIDALKVDSADKSDLITAAKAEIYLDWPKPFKPALTKIVIDEPTLKPSFDGQSFSLGGLEDLGGASGESAGPPPEIFITDGQLELDTPAGTVRGAFSASGLLPKNGEASFSLAPTELSQNGNQVSLQSGELNLRAENAELTGKLRLEIAAASLNGLQITDLSLNGMIADAASPKIEWSFESERLNQNGMIDIAGISAQGAVQLFDFDMSEQASMLDAISNVTAIGSATRVETGDFEGSTIEFEILGAQDTVSPPMLEVELAGFDLISPYANVRKGSVGWIGSIDVESRTYNGGGNLILENARIDENIRQLVTKNIGADGVLSGHLSALRQALERGLSNVSTGAQYRVQGTFGSDWNVSLPGTIALNSRSGLSVLMTPAQSGEGGIQVTETGLQYAGLIDIKGGGAPTLKADVRNFTLTQDETSLQTGGFTIAPWTEADITLRARLNRFGFRSKPSTTSAEALGEVGFDGPIYGLDLNNARVFGGVSALRGAEGWRAQTLDRDCLGLDIDSVRIGGTFDLSKIAFPICPEDGRFIRQNSGHAEGKVSLGDVAVQIQGKDIAGTAALQDANLNWSTENGLQFEVQAEQLDFPTTIGTRTLRAISDAPSVSLFVNETTRLQASLENTVLSGSLVPANVTIGTTNLRSKIIPSGLTGSARSTDVRITDINADPIYRPLVAEFDASFDGTGMNLFGPVSLDRDVDIPIADAKLQLDLVRLNGTASVKSRELVFVPKGFQPTNLSDRVRSLFSNGRGSLAGSADFNINRGALSGVGEVAFKDFGFDTFRIGAIEGVTGSITFSDILALTTPPSQQVTIKRINPGIQLDNGTLAFQILGGREANIETAVWPFAGGTLEVEPNRWTIAGVSDVVTINARQIELAELVDALSLPDVQASGTVSGTFPLELRGGSTIIKNALLVADAKGGTLKYTGEAVNQAASTDQTVSAAFTALRDFRFKVLELGIDGNLVGDIVVSLNLLGFNPEVFGGADFKFNIAIDSKLAQLIQSGRDLTGTSIITETVVNEVRSNRASQP
ncbi:MAG: YdbH domain-containing protein [Henriciella sp.]|jgi:hypothetical protein